MMKYKGYIGKVEHDSDEKLFHGEVIGLKDTITFQATNAEDLEREFRKSIDVYLDWYKELGEKEKIHVLRAHKFDPRLLEQDFTCEYLNNSLDNGPDAFIEALREVLEVHGKSKDLKLLQRDQKYVKQFISIINAVGFKMVLQPIEK